MDVAMAAISRSRCPVARSGFVAPKESVDPSGSPASPARGRADSAWKEADIVETIGAFRSSDEPAPAHDTHVRDHRHVAHPRRLGPGIARGQLGATYDRLEHHPLLGHRQRGSEAAADPTPERDPGVRTGLARKEALGAEDRRLGVDVGAVVEAENRDG